MLEQYLWLAVNSEVGYKIVTPELQKLRNKLYQTRQQAQREGNNAFDNLSFLEMPDGQTLYIVRHEALQTYRDSGGVDPNDVGL